MQAVMRTIREIGLIPVLKVPAVSDARPLAAALIGGGIPLIEVTLRNAWALEVIRTIKTAFPDMTVGAGTVLDPETAESAVEAGADFIVSPGFNAKTVAWCQSAGVAVIPGCVTPCEIEQGLERGLTVFKFFPAEPNGGLQAVKLLGGPYPDVRFIPTGGITFDNLPDYIGSDRVLACGGSFMATADQIAAQDFDGITASCRRAVDLSLGFALAHVGINFEGADGAVRAAEAVAGRFRLPVAEGHSSVFAGKAVEMMKSPYYGTNGHIGFYTRSVERALAFFRREGIRVKEDSIRTTAQGRLQSAYLEDEVGGFALHILQK